ncbi:MAG: hypothetical protein RBU45_06030 [Myxococcota bacterium]|jgi:hypothetical protein|nr:hypothetical protein [Myxococcota bacterium]
MTLRDREKVRVAGLKPALFSAAACLPGVYNKIRRPFCLHEDHSDENLCPTLRQQAIRYFDARKIGWHDGIKSPTGPERPSNHLCCSQSFCVNVWFPFIDAPLKLAAFLRDLGFDAVEALPIDLDLPLDGGQRPYVAFEWIGRQNYLRERHRGSIAPDMARDRGKGFTSADVIVRFRRTDGKIQIVLVEWKYTELYIDSPLQCSKSGTDRLNDIYRPELTHQGCPIRIPEGACHSFLFFDPFDQMMRAQLLAAAMERNTEMQADVVSCLHLTPRCNAELNHSINSSGLRRLGSTIHDVWGTLVTPDRFQARHVEDVVAAAIRHAPDPVWASDLQQRYAGMR